MQSMSERLQLEHCAPGASEGASQRIWRSQHNDQRTKAISKSNAPSFAGTHRTLLIPWFSFVMLPQQHCDRSFGQNSIHSEQAVGETLSVFASVPACSELPELSRLSLRLFRP